MSSVEIHSGDIGVVFRRTLKDQSLVVVDVSTATVKQILFQKPDGTDVTKTASFTTNGSDGKVQYTTVASDLNVTGRWQGQVYVELPSGKFHSDVWEFDVLPNIS